MSEQRSQTESRLPFLVGISIGAPLVAVATYELVSEAGSSGAIAVGRWLVGANLVHDLVIAPMVCLSGWALVRVAPPTLPGTDRSRRDHERRPARRGVPRAARIRPRSGTGKPHRAAARLRACHAHRVGSRVGRSPRHGPPRASSGTRPTGSTSPRASLDGLEPQLTASSLSIESGLATGRHTFDARRPSFLLAIAIGVGDPVRDHHAHRALDIVFTTYVHPVCASLVIVAWAAGGCAASTPIEQQELRRTGTDARPDSTESLPGFRSRHQVTRTRCCDTAPSARRRARWMPRPAEPRIRRCSLVVAHASRRQRCRRPPRRVGPWRVLRIGRSRTQPAGALTADRGPLLARSAPADGELQAAGLLHDVGSCLAPGRPRTHAGTGGAFVTELLGPRVGWLVSNHDVASEPGHHRFRVLVPTRRSQLRDLRRSRRSALDREQLRLRESPWFADLLTLRYADDSVWRTGRRHFELHAWRPVLEWVATWRRDQIAVPRSMLAEP